MTDTGISSESLVAQLERIVEAIKNGEDVVFVGGYTLDQKCLALAYVMPNTEISYIVATLDSAARMHDHVIDYVRKNYAVFGLQKATPGASEKAN